ncbi:MAG TPA: NHL repeat-containing protein [Verrucomicrobiae bacterium]|nr:NHL repeat-containing protein [Verrucomicrobiae bacterium]
MKTIISHITPGSPLRARLSCIFTCLTLALVSIPALSQTAYPSPYSFTTLSGKCSAEISGNEGSCHFHPKSVAVNATGDVYFSDIDKHVVCRILPSGQVAAVAGKLGVPGSADGLAGQARFCRPSGIAIDTAGNVFVADTCNNTIRRITLDGMVTTVAGLAGAVGSTDGKGIYARFNCPISVAVDRLDNVFVADLYNNTIRKVTSNGDVTTLAGQPDSPGSVDGWGSAALFNFPIGVAVDGFDNVYVADLMNNAIRRITITGRVTTLAGFMSYIGGNADGVGGAARFRHPSGIVLDSAGNIYVADSGNQTIRRITPNGAVTTVAGLAGNPGFIDGIGSDARFWHPASLALDRLGTLYVTDVNNAAIRKGVAAGSKNATLSLTAKPKTFFHD